MSQEFCAVFSFHLSYQEQTIPKDPNYLCYYIVCQCPFLSHHLSVLTLFRKFNLCHSLISSIFNGNLPSFKTINMLKHADNSKLQINDIRKC